MGREAIMKALGPYISSSAPKRNPIRPAVLFELGLMGGEESQSKRDAAAQRLGLISGMSAKAFRAAAEIVTTEEELIKASEL